MGGQRKSSGCGRCGRCCNERIYGLNVFKDEPFYENILRKAALLGNRVTIKESKFLLSIDFNQEGCMFFDKGCSIYEIRPLACRIFPFVAEVSEKSSHFVLTAHCPLVAEFEKLGVDFVLHSEIIGKFDSKSGLPLLMTSLRDLAKGINERIVPAEVKLHYDESAEELIFPISTT